MSDEPVQVTLSVRILFGAAEHSPFVRLVKARIDDIALVSVWLLLVVVALNVRPLLPIDETRYLTVAWEMWQRESFLVPLLNGEAYSHKPPLLFWLIDAGWSIFGVREWWGRLVAPLFGLAGLFTARQLAGAVWPDAPRRVELVPWLLLGCVAWALFTTVTMFDMLIVTFVALAMLGLVQVWHGRALLGWAMVAVALGLGGLAKGPVVLVYTLPPALLAPLWMRPHAIRWPAYYASLITAVVAGVALVLAWALPAARAGGPDYSQAILWGQTAGRVADAFAHERAWWWYLPVLPALWFPWILWPAAWRGVVAAARNPDSGVRMALVWLGSGLLVLSFISAKQPHYALPLFPAIAMLLAAGLERVTVGRWNAFLPATAVIAVGVALAGFAYWLRNTNGAIDLMDLPEFARSITPWFGVAVAIVGLLVLLNGKVRARAAVLALALQSAAIVVLVHLLGFLPIAFAYDVQPAAKFIFASQMSYGRTVAALEEYHGQFGFAGRLVRPLRIVSQDAALIWLDGDSRRRMVLFIDVPFPRWMQPEYQQPYRGRTLAIIDYNTWEAYVAWTRAEARRVAAAKDAPARLAPAATAPRPGQPD